MEYVKALKEITPFLTALVALVAVFVGPFIQAYFVRRQVIAPIRQKWIEELRDLLVDFLSTAQMLVVKSGDGLLYENNFDEKNYKKMNSIERKLTLMLNPNEDLHNQLLDSVRSLLDKTNDGPGDLLEFGPNVGEITEISQIILKQEWSRVKKGKL